MSSRLKFIIIMSCIIVVGLSIIVGASYDFMASEIVDEVNSRNEMIGNSVTGEIRQFLWNVKGIVEVTSQLDMFKDLSEYKLSSVETRGVPQRAMLEQRTYFKSLQDQYPYISLLAVQTAVDSLPIMFEPYDMQVSMTEEAYYEGFAYRDYFKRMMETESTVFGDVMQSHVVHQYLLPVATPVKDQNGKILTMVGAGVSMENVSNMMTSLKFGSTGMVYLITDNGSVLGRPEVTNNEELASLSDSDFISSLNEADGPQSMVDPFTGDRVIASVNAIDELGWYVITQQNENEAMSGLHVMVNMMLILASLVLVGQIALSAYIISAWIIKPVISLTKATEHMANGDYEHVETYSKTMFKEIDTLSEDFNTMARQVHEREDEMRQYVFVASHDLQEPLRMVISYLQIIERKYGDLVDEKGKRYIFYAVDGAKRMKQLIQDLLMYSKMGGEYQLDDVVNLNALLDHVYHTLKFQIDENNAVVEWENLPTITGNKGCLEQLFMNLIANALKYRSEKSPIVKVASLETESYVEISISDNGIGVAPEHLQEIFVIFKRLHSRESYEGTGIGLSICKKIVEKHSGHIFAESDGQNGTRIVIQFSKQIVI